MGIDFDVRYRKLRVECNMAVCLYLHLWINAHDSFMSNETEMPFYKIASDIIFAENMFKVEHDTEYDVFTPAYSTVSFLGEQ
jgi:hypothetical protein